MTQYNLQEIALLYFSPSTEEKRRKFMTTGNICTYLQKAYAIQNDEDIKLEDYLVERALEEAGFIRIVKGNKSWAEFGYYVKDRYNPIQSKKIHKNLKKSVNLFRYWTTCIETYTHNRGRLSELEQILMPKSVPNFQLRSANKQPQKTNIWLSEQIDMFNKKDLRQSVVIIKFFEKCIEENEWQNLSLDRFRNIEPEKINKIIHYVEENVVKGKNKAENTKNVTEKYFNKNASKLILEIESLRSEDVIKIKKESVESEIKEIEDIGANLKRVLSESEKKDKTNFAAAEVGFLIEVQAVGDNEPHIEYYHYPVTLTNKNTFSIYDLQNEEFNYCYAKKILCYGNYIVEDVLLKHNQEFEREKNSPINDNHSENALFFAFQQRSFQERMIKKLIRDLKKKKLKLTKLENVILEIHSTNDICPQCFKKAKYLIDWKKENSKQGLEYFRKKFFKMLKKKKVLDEKLDTENSLLKVLITWSHDEKGDKVTKEPNPHFIRFDIKEEKFDSTLITAQLLSKYSIITSGGVAKAHNNYSYAYNKAVEPARIHAAEIIQDAWRRLKWKKLMRQLIERTHIVQSK